MLASEPRRWALAALLVVGLGLGAVMAVPGVSQAQEDTTITTETITESSVDDTGTEEADDTGTDEDRVAGRGGDHDCPEDSSDSSES